MGVHIIFATGPVFLCSLDVAAVEAAGSLVQWQPLEGKVDMAVPVIPIDFTGEKLFYVSFVRQFSDVGTNISSFMWMYGTGPAGKTVVLTKPHGAWRMLFGRSIMEVSRSDV